MLHLLASLLLQNQPGRNESRFCWYCRIIFSELLQDQEGTDSWLWEFLLSHIPRGALEKRQSIHELRKGAANGCVACRVLLSSFTVEEQNYASKHGQGRLLFNETVREETGYEDKVVDIVLQLPVRKELLHSVIDKHVSATLTVHMNHDSKADELMPILSGTTDDDVTWTTAKQWLLECTKGQDHHYCRENIMTPRLPKRLVLISSDGKSTRLCLTHQIRSRSNLRYLTLSHSWGKGPMPLRTTRDNLDSLLQNIPFENLSKTFQDAITTTHRLGFQYIWIDSLCILQDDDDDLVNEAIKAFQKMRS